jgi:hypothetical protein
VPWGEVGADAIEAVITRGGDQSDGAMQLDRIALSETQFRLTGCVKLAGSYMLSIKIQSAQSSPYASGLPHTPRSGGKQLILQGESRFRRSYRFLRRVSLDDVPNCDRIQTAHMPLLNLTIHCLCRYAAAVVAT